MWPGLTGNRNNGPVRTVLPIYFSATRAGDGGEAGRERDVSCFCSVKLSCHYTGGGGEGWRGGGGAVI